RDLPVSYSLRAQAEQVLGHSEAALRDDRTHAKILPNFAQRYYEPESLGWALPLARASVDRLLGDFRAATAENVGVVATRGLPGDRIGEASNRIQDHDISAGLKILRSLPSTTPTTKLGENGSRALALIQLEDWAGLAEFNASQPPVTRTAQRLAAF